MWADKTNERSVFRRNDLLRLLEPKSIAIVGASADPGSFGARTRTRLNSFGGPVYLVNPKYERLGDSPCYPAVSRLPEVPDCVIITVGYNAVEVVATDCASVGVGGAVIYAAGFAETGDADRIALQSRLTALSRDSGMRIVGPNCVGVANFARHSVLMFFSDIVVRETFPHSIGIASQSGGVGNGLAQAVNAGVSVSHVLTAGNSCDVDVADYVAYLAEDPHCGAIACVFEGVRSPERLIEASELAWRVDKPLIVYKLAARDEGAAIALSHTGTIAGSFSAYRAALEKTGAVMVGELEDLIEVASFFAKMPAPLGKGTAVVSTSGGATVLAADKAAACGVALPQPGEQARTVLQDYLPSFSAPKNPCDLTGQVLNNEEGSIKCIDALLCDPQYAALVLPVVYGTEATTRRNVRLGDLAQRYGKAACTVLLSGWGDAPGAKDAERSPNLAIFRSMRRCFSTLAAWYRRAELRANGPAEDGS